MALPFKDVGVHQNARADLGIFQTRSFSARSLASNHFNPIEALPKNQAPFLA